MRDHGTLTLVIAFAAFFLGCAVTAGIIAGL